MRFGSRRLSPAILGCAVVVLACRPRAPGASATDSVVLRTDKAHYRAGEKMTLTLENRGGSSYTFNPCTRTLERQEGSSWTALPDEGRMCTMEAWMLDARGTKSGPTELPASITPGRYRVLVRLTQERTDASGAPVVATSDPITIS